MATLSKWIPASIYLFQPTSYARKKLIIPVQIILSPQKEGQFSIIKNPINEEKGEEKEKNLTESLCAPEPYLDYSVTELTKRVDKMSVYDNYEKIILDEEKKENEKIFTKNGVSTSDDNYFD